MVVDARKGSQRVRGRWNQLALTSAAAREEHAARREIHGARELPGRDATSRYVGSVRSRRGPLRVRATDVKMTTSNG